MSKVKKPYVIQKTCKKCQYYNPEARGKYKCFTSRCPAYYNIKIPPKEVEVILKVTISIPKEVRGKVDKEGMFNSLKEHLADEHIFVGDYGCSVKDINEGLV